MTSEPHIMVEKEIPWAEFMKILDSAYAVEIFNRVFLKDRIYLDEFNDGCPEISSNFIISPADNIGTFYLFDKNETIKYGFGQYWIHCRMHDYVEDGTDDFYVEDGTDDFGYPTFKKLTTYKLKLVPIQILQVQKYEI